MKKVIVMPACMLAICAASAQENKLGLNYVLEGGNHFGIRAGYTVTGSTFKKDLDLPAGLNANDKRLYGGYTPSLQYGIRF